MTEQEKKIVIDDFYANKFAVCFAALSMLAFGGAYFVGTKTADFDSLLLAVKQVLVPAMVIGGFGYTIGKFFDIASKRPAKTKKTRMKY